MQLFLSKQWIAKLSSVLCNVASGGRGEEDGGGAKSNDGEKAWSAINNSILSEVNISGQITAKSSALYILFNI